MKKIKLILALCALSQTVFAQNAITTYTLTPYARSGVNVSTALTTSAGQTGDYPTNIMYPIFSRDSISVQFWNASSGEKITARPDSLKHFYTGSVNLNTVQKMDSFFHAAMTK